MNNIDVNKALKFLKVAEDELGKGHALKMGEVAFESFKMAVSALEKQMPKKSIRVRVGVNDETDGCPICKNEFWEKVDFCSKCGQAIDWNAKS